ncbi:MAG: WD40 repeat domain-containing protein, partial [Candidatus Xenobia bacterium]
MKHLLLGLLLLLASTDPLAILGDSVHLAVLSPDRQTVAFWAEGHVSVWDLQDEKESWQWVPHGSPVWLAMAPDKSLLLLGESQQRVAAWTPDGKYRWSMPWEGSRPLVISRHARHAVGRSGDGFSARIYDMASGTFRRAVTWHALLQTWSYAPDGRLFLGWGDGLLEVRS